MQYLYMLKAGQEHYKVGITSNVSSRAHGLQLHNPELIQIVVTKLVDKPYDAEQEIHKTLESMKASGANEWFTLTPEQAIEVAITINKYPDLDVSEQVTLNGIVRQQRVLLKSMEKKLDFVINTYQNHFMPRYSRKTDTEKYEKVAQEPIPEDPAGQSYEPETENAFPAEDAEEQIYEKAKAVVIDENRASTSLLQRRLRIGYGRAARMIERLEKEGAVGPEDGSRPRRVNVPEQITSTI